MKQHCTYFRETIQNEGSKGKKLGFVAQEIGREVNTIGSKANHVEIQKQDLQNITFEELLTFLKDVKPNEKQSKKDCLIQLLNKNKIKYEKGLWDEAV